MPERSGPARPVRPKIGDVAALAGVSKSAVSFVFNDRPGVGDDARQRVLAAAAELGWYPNAQARALANRQALALGLVIHRRPELLASDPFFTKFLTGIEVELSRRRYALVLQVVPDAEAEHASYSRLVLDDRVAGVFITDLRVDDRRPQLLEELGLPGVYIAPPSFPGFPKVTVDDAAGTRAAIEHLVELGHRRIAHVSGAAGYLHSEIRRTAWQEAVESLGLAPGPLVEADFTGPGGAAATEQLLDLPEPPTAIFYANDLMAIAGMQVAGRRGLVLPDDLSIIGFDDVPMAPFVSPALTTIRQDAVRWGEAAARTLLAFLEQSPVKRIELPAPALIVRGSTAPPSTNKREQ